MNFNIQLKETKDTIIVSYNQKTMEKLPQELASDLLFIIKEKHSSPHRFFEFNPAQFAYDVLNENAVRDYLSQHNSTFNNFKDKVIKSILNNATNDENYIYEALNTLYKYKDIISNVSPHHEFIQYRIINKQLIFKDNSFLHQLSQTFAADFPSYLIQFSNYEHAVKNNTGLPAAKIYSLSDDTKGYIYDNFYEAYNNQHKPYTYMTFLIEGMLHQTCKNANDIFNTLKIVEAINQEITNENQPTEKRKHQKI